MRIKTILLCLTIFSLLSLTSCLGQGPSAGSGPETATQENLPEYTGTQEKAQDTSEGSTDKKGNNASEKTTEFSGLDVEESTEIQLEEGQEIVLD